MPFANVFTTVVFPPARIVKKLRLDEVGRVRIDGEINEVRFEAAINPSKSGWYIMLSKRFRKECGLDVGDTARVCFDLANPDAVHVPNELRFAIEASGIAEKAWDATTTGKKRSFSHYVDSAKRPATREKRVDEVLDILLGKKELPKRKRK